MAKSVMAHSFSQVPRAKIPRSSFNRSHGLKTTFDADYLVPILVDDVVPGDTFNVRCQHLARLSSPLTYPIMDNLYLDTFFFFVPYRLLWDNWEKFCGSQDDPGDSIDFTIPVVTHPDATYTDEDSLWTYFGLPLDATPANHAVSALPFRAYTLIWNEWFRDQNLQDHWPIDTGNGPDTLHATYSATRIKGELWKRGKRHDYFTSCLPWPQKGDAVDLPLGTEARIAHDISGSAAVSVYSTDNARYDKLSADTIDVQSDNNAGIEGNKLYADLTGATAATINELRLAFQTQRLLERDARSGTRYVETILAHFGVVVPDFRVQRPEFLGGGSTRINVNQVQNNSGTTGDLGDLSAFGISVGSDGFTKSFVEHGVVIGMANVRGDITYSQGIDRYWLKSTRYDFYYPVLSQIGEQAVTNEEIYAQGSAADDTVFGYQERYAELRYKQSRMTGLMHPNATGTLAAWHLSEDFASLPTLGDTFIQSNTGTPLDRAVAVPSEPHIVADFYFDMTCARPMPLYGVPGNLDHF